MKSWRKPKAIGQQFVVNEYISACTVTVKCDYWPTDVNWPYYDLLVPTRIKGGAPGVDVSKYDSPCNTEYTYDVNVSALKPITFTQEGGGDDIAPHSAYYWIELDENGGKDFHVTSIFAEELAAANAS